MQIQYHLIKQSIPQDDHLFYLLVKHAKNYLCTHATKLCNELCNEIKVTSNKHKK